MRPCLSLVLVGTALLVPPTWAGAGVVAVSPVAPSGIAVVESRCPTFSWAGIEEARSHELVVYRLGENGEPADELIRQSLPAAASSWTPSLDGCLERGRSYAWAVRAVGRKGASDWSPPSLFQVSAGPSEAEFEEALQVVRSYLDARPGEALSAVGASVDSSPVLREESLERATKAAAPQTVAFGGGGIFLNADESISTSAAADSRNATVVTFTDMQAPCAAGNRGEIRQWVIEDIAVNTDLDALCLCRMKDISGSMTYAWSCFYSAAAAPP